MSKEQMSGDLYGESSLDYEEAYWHHYGDLDDFYSSKRYCTRCDDRFALGMSDLCDRCEDELLMQEVEAFEKEDRRLRLKELDEEEARFNELYTVQESFNKKGRRGHRKCDFVRSCKPSRESRFIHKVKRKISGSIGMSKDEVRNKLFEQYRKPRLRQLIDEVLNDWFFHSHQTESGKLVDERGCGITPHGPCFVDGVMTYFTAKTRRTSDWPREKHLIQTDKNGLQSWYSLKGGHWFRYEEYSENTTCHLSVNEVFPNWSKGLKHNWMKLRERRAELNNEIRQKGLKKVVSTVRVRERQCSSEEIQRKGLDSLRSMALDISRKVA